MKHFNKLLLPIVFISIISAMLLYSCKKISLERSFIIHLVTNGGSDMSDLVVASGAEIKKPVDPVKKDSLLEGWYIDKKLTQPFNFGVIYYTTKGFDLFAKWTQFHTIKFYTNGAAPIDSEVVSAGKYVIKPSNPEKEGYTFVGWYSDDALLTLYDFEQSVHHDITLFAKWEVGLFYNVNFITNGANNVPSQLIEFGKFAVRPTVSIESKTLEGWYSDANFLSPFDFVNTPITSEISLYAKWATPNPENDFIFDAVSGAIMKYTGSSIDVVIPEKIQGQTVKILGYGLFMNTSVRTVVLPSSITTLASQSEFGFDNVSRTFQGCNLVSINLFNTNITILPKWTFMFSTLGSFVLPGTLAEIQQGAFESSVINNIIIPNSVTKIEQYAFFRCKNLTKVILGQSLITIGDGAFAESSILSSVIITRDVLPVTTIGQNDNPFRDIAPSFSIKVPNSVLDGYKASWAGLSGKMVGY